MEIAFISNIPNHYQACFADGMRKKGITYWFLATERVSEERMKLGFSNDFEQMGYVVSISDDPERTKEIIDRCDLLLTAFYANELAAERMKAGKLTFVVSERICKSTGRELRSVVMNSGRIVKYRHILKKYGYCQSAYFLLIGQYAIDDYIRCGVLPDKILKFAYFQEISRYP